MQQFASDPRFLLIRGHQQGMYVDWNECLRHIETEYFYFLTSDDTCYPELVSTTTSALDKYKDIDACHFKFAMIDGAGKIIQDYDQIVRRKFPLYSDLINYTHQRSGICEFFMHCVYRSLYITITSLVFRYKTIEKLESFSSQYGTSGDYDWTMRLGLITDVLYIPKLLATWRIHQNQMTQNTQSPDVIARNLAIANKNLEIFIAKPDLSKRIKKPLDIDNILSHLSYEYRFRLFRDNLFTINILRSAWHLQLLLRKHAKLFFSYGIRWFRNDKSSWLYSSRTKSVVKLIRNYGLEWPPTKVNL
jgi:hypothetical protein